MGTGNIWKSGIMKIYNNDGYNKWNSTINSKWYWRWWLRGMDVYNKNSVRFIHPKQWQDWITLTFVSFHFEVEFIHNFPEVRHFLNRWSRRPTMTLLEPILTVLTVFTRVRLWDDGRVRDCRWVAGVTMMVTTVSSLHAVSSVGSQSDQQTVESLQQ